MGSFIGILLHSIGGFAAGSFYIPMNFVKKWSWESAWLVLGFAAWLITPLFVAWLTVPNLGEILFAADGSVRFWTYFFGLLWGIGGLTFGLSMRYLGIALGMTIALGFCTAFGTLIPPIYDGTFFDLLQTKGGIITLIGVALSLVGILITGKAGSLKEKDFSANKQSDTVKEFNLTKGLIIAIISGILSASFAYGLAAGKPIADIALAEGTQNLFQNNASLVWILWGGITSNLIWVIFLNIRNKTYTDYSNKTTPLAKNYMWAALGGLTWYMQFFFYGMGTTFLSEEYEFASWSLHMASIIFFSNMWGLYFNEWKGVSRKTKQVLSLGLTIIVTSFIIIGMSGAF